MPQTPYEIAREYESTVQKDINQKMSTGTVKWFNSRKGFGFIVPDGGGDDLFVHHSEIRAVGYALLEKGQKVEFQIGQCKKGPCATNVTPL